ncbi:MAG TPA: sigma-54 dependent transcriptional regulator [Bacteroidota bacterium]|jgi:two-component system response regulator PilR (NtrC family)|nr:sigma-54 dependent transcriptional regulator [Bacteroidota bacterium]
MADRILVVDDEQIIRESISFVLKKEGYAVVEAANGKEAYDKLCTDAFDLVLTDLEMPEMKGIELLDHAVHMNSEAIVIIITAYGSLETAITALRKGASDYILKPIEFDELLVKVRRLLDNRKVVLENQYLRKVVNSDYDFSKLVGKSAEMKKVFEMIQKVAGTDSNVLISGKSGTGKELVARAIHFNSRRNNKQFIAVNAGAIPESLIESELFGHRKGSFTGAVADKIGYFKAADGGTLLLDEISEMPLQLQVKLLRALEQKEITPVGMTTAIPVNVRIIASTNRNLQGEVEAGRFREDLYYRLNVVEIHLPSLSERRDDIPLLIDHFIQKYSNEMSKNIKGTKNDVMRLLMQHTWKGEIRELENIIERAVIFSSHEHITMDDLPGFLQPESGVTVPTDKASLEAAIKDFERQYILTILRKCSFNKEHAAHDLGVSLPTLYRRIKDLGIEQE